MDSIFFFFFFISFLSISPSITASDILKHPPLKCHNSSNNPTIQHPFYIQNQQPKKCGLSAAFELNCNHPNFTTLHFPSYGDLIVKSISYDTQWLDLLDPKNCVHEVFLNLNLSETPFTYYYALKKHKYLKCLQQLPASAANYNQVPCLSGSGLRFYVVEETFADVPVFCRHVKTVAIPFSYSPYLNDNGFGLRLTWKKKGSDEADEQQRGFINIMAGVGVLFITMFILVAMVLHYVWTSMSNKLEEKIKMDNEVRNEALMGECEVFSSPREHSMFHVKLVR